MTAKECREMNRLKVRVEELEAQVKKGMEIYAHNIEEIVKLRIALRNSHDAIVDAVVEMNSVIQDTDKIDRRLEVRGDF